MKKEMAFVLAIFLAFTVLAGCASGPPKIPYPAFVQVDMLDDVFMASLPGVRAKQLSGDPQSRRTSNRINLPPDWQGTSGAAPGRSLEIFVIAGEIQLADITLDNGGYAYLPAGSLGFNISSRDGAQILYFVHDADERTVIRSPIIIDSDLLDWESSPKVGVSLKELRIDPGSGAKTWLMKISTGASQAWTSSSTVREGYLVTGNQQYEECVNGDAEQWQYSPGGYFYRPPNTINGGPESLALTPSIWFLREAGAGVETTWSACKTIETEYLDEPVD